jgi:hypothetical protein
MSKSVFLGAISAIAGLSGAYAADLPLKAAPPSSVFDMPFFFGNDNRFTYAYLPSGTEVGNPGNVTKQIFALTHFDVWAYGTNYANLQMLKDDHNYPAGPCPVFGNGCAGTTEFYGVIRSTFGFNEIFNTKAFTMGPLRNVSFEVGGDGKTQNSRAQPRSSDGL